MQHVQRVHLAPSDNDEFVFFYDHDKNGHAYSRTSVAAIKPLEIASSACCFKLPKGSSAVVDTYQNSEPGSPLVFDVQINNCQAHTPLTREHVENLHSASPVFHSLAESTMLFMNPGPSGPGGICTLPLGSSPCSGQTSRSCPDPTNTHAFCDSGTLVCRANEPPEG